LYSGGVDRIAELSPQLVTFNGSSFDLPVLRYRIRDVMEPVLTALWRTQAAPHRTSASGSSPTRRDGSRSTSRGCRSCWGRASASEQEAGSSQGCPGAPLNPVPVRRSAGTRARAAGASRASPAAAHEARTRGRCACASLEPRKRRRAGTLHRAAPSLPRATPGAAVADGLGQRRCQRPSPPRSRSIEISCCEPTESFEGSPTRWLLLLVISRGVGSGQCAPTGIWASPSPFRSDLP
jgi:Predicted 3'-5' exonuclease related to the exonuclease domain of PolB